MPETVAWLEERKARRAEAIEVALRSFTEARQFSTEGKLSESERLIRYCEGVVLSLDDQTTDEAFTEAHRAFTSVLRPESYYDQDRTDDDISPGMQSTDFSQSQEGPYQGADQPGEDAHQQPAGLENHESAWPPSARAGDTAGEKRIDGERLAEAEMLRLQARYNLAVLCHRQWLRKSDPEDSFKDPYPMYKLESPEDKAKKDKHLEDLLRNAVNCYWQTIDFVQTRLNIEQHPLLDEQDLKRISKILRDRPTCDPRGDGETDKAYKKVLLTSRRAGIFLLASVGFLNLLSDLTDTDWKTLPERTLLPKDKKVFQCADETLKLAKTICKWARKMEKAINEAESPAKRSEAY